VVRIDISGRGENQHVTATAFGKEILFHFDQQRHVWSALVGIDLETKPGSYDLQVKTSDAAEVNPSVQVLPKSFPVRRLRVAENFVNPPPEALEQIARDNKTIAKIYAQRSPKRWLGTFVLPVDGKPTSNFGTRSYYNGRPRSPHNGVDFVSEPGTPVRASNHGVVVMAEALYFTGNTVIVDYGAGLFSLFAHLSEFRIGNGDTVAPETIIGLVGATGRVTGPHLHWSVRLAAARVDPLSLVAATR
jgi:murein DD-endopeptidase MepM/ murein hydrolase activator NlpD